MKKISEPYIFLLMIIMIPLEGIAQDYWSITGNKALDSNRNFLGTTDKSVFIIRVNNEPSGRIEPRSTGNMVWGYQAFINNRSGGNNTAIGMQTLYANNSGSANTATGAYSLKNNTSGFFNVAMGHQALSLNDGGYGNTAIGAESMPNGTQGAFNTAVGISTMYNNVIGAHNTVIGAGANITGGDLQNATAIGAYTVVNASHKLRIGNVGVSVIEGQVPFTTPSDGRYKYQVLEDVKGLDFILQLRAVTYQFDAKKFSLLLEGNSTRNMSAADSMLQAAYIRASGIRRSGFIAQEVEQAALKTGYDFSGIIKPQSQDDYYSLSYESFVVPLVKAVQEQQKIIDTLVRANQEQAEAYDALIKRIENLEKNNHK